MREYLDVLKTVNIFDSLADNDILSVLVCLNADIVDYGKNAVVLDENCFNNKIGIVLSGQLQNIIMEYSGAQSIIAVFNNGDMFAESLVCAEVTAPPFTVFASVDSKVLFLDYNKILNVCKNTCAFHMALIQNMLKILANKNLLLNTKLRHLTKRTTKEKLLSYLSEFSYKCGSNTFTIPLNRQNLADYLSVERSAMSAELNKLRINGTISFIKNTFTLKK